MADEKLSTNPLGMWAVTPEEGFLDDTVAVFKEEGLAEEYKRVLDRTGWGCSLCVVKVTAELELVMEED